MSATTTAASSSSDLETRLQRYFERQFQGPVRVLDLESIVGGYSRAMSRFAIEDQSGELRRYVLRADPPPGVSILDTDRSREWAVLEALCASGAVPLPTARYFDATGEDLGSPSIIIDLVDGTSLKLRTEVADTDEQRFLVEELCRLAVRLHGCPVDQLPAVLERPSSWDSYIDSRIQAWVEAERAHSERVPFMRWVAAWLDRHRPPPAPLGLVHGDFQSPNVLIDSGGNFLLIDWELTHIGDPREDFGWWALAAASQPPDLIADHMDEFCAQYREATGLDEATFNPLTIAYFTVLASVDVYASLLRQGAVMAKGESTSMSVAYMTVAEPFMHGVWVGAIDRIIQGGKS